MKLTNLFYLRIFQRWNTPSAVTAACRIVVGISLLSCLPALLVPMGLSAEVDAIDYRIPIVKWILRHHSYPNWPWSMVDDYPMLGELLMTPLYWIHPNLARLVPIFGYALLGYSFGKLLSWWGDEHSTTKTKMLFWLGFSWALTLRPVLLQSNLLMVDNLAAAFLMLATYYALKKASTYAALWIALSMATRYTTWGTCFFLFFFVLFNEYRKPRKDWRGICSFVVLSSLGALPFLIRNYFVNDGHFLYPIGVPAAYANQNFLFYGRGKDLLSFLLLPYDILVTNSFISGIFDYTLGKLFYMQLGVYGWIAVAKKTGFGLLNKEKTKCLLLVMLAHTIYWFATSQQMRFYTIVLLLILAIFILTLEQFRFRFLMVLLTILGIFSLKSVQSESITLAFSERENLFAQNAQSLESCLASAGYKGGVIGIVSRDGTLGFFDFDFMYLPPHPFSVKVEGNSLPDWILGPGFFDGYERVPSRSPCILRKKIS